MYSNYINDQDNPNEYQPYSYEGYGGRDSSEQSSRNPTSATSPVIQTSPIQDLPKEKKPGKAPRIIAAALGITLLAGGAGGGAAWYVVSNYQVPAQASAAAAPIVTQQAVASGGITTDVSGVVATVSDSVVEIVTSTPGNPFYFQQTLEGAGSGVVVSEEGYIITNNHVVDGAQSIKIRTGDGTEYDAALIGTDSKTDLAVIKVEATGLKPVTFADSDTIQVGQVAVAIGNPLGQLGGTVTSGIISATGREITIDGETMHLLQTSAAINPGNSGGGLFDENGYLVGIVNAKSSGINIEGLGFAIPSNTVKEVVNDIIENGYVTGRPQFGISVIEVTDSYALAMYRLQNPGVYIASDDNPEGLQAGDRIVSIEGEEISSSSQISNILSEHAVGDTLTMAVQRGNDEITVQVTLTEMVPEGMQTVQNEI